MRFAIALLGLMATVGILVAVNSPGGPSVETVFASAPSAAPEPFRSNADLLGEIRVTVDKDDPLYRELVADDRRNGRT